MLKIGLDGGAVVAETKPPQRSISFGGGTFEYEMTTSLLYPVVTVICHPPQGGTPIAVSTPRLTPDRKPVPLMFEDPVTKKRVFSLAVTCTPRSYFSPTGAAFRPVPELSFS